MRQRRTCDNRDGEKHHGTDVTGAGAECRLRRRRPTTSAAVTATIIAKSLGAPPGHRSPAPGKLDSILAIKAITAVGNAASQASGTAIG
jgi:hypothetical protein